MQEGTTSRVMAADRTYDKFYDFYSVSLENFGSTHVLGLLEPVTDGLSMYVHELWAIGRRGCTGRDLNEKTLAADSGH